VIELCERYAAREVDRAALRSQRAYVSMMNARSRTYLAIQNGLYEAALGMVEEGLRTLHALHDPDDDESCSCAREIQTLKNLRQEVLDKMPTDCPARLRSDLQAALRREDYESAARIRDRLSDLGADEVDG
jgi:hypothetical protein